MAWSRYSLGYHGTSGKIARRIVNLEEPLRSSRNKYDWLGHGYYFWEDSPQRALQWAQEKHSHDPGVLGVVIDLGNCLDLVESQAIAIVREAYCAFLATMEKEGVEPPKNKGRNLFSRNLDCAVFEYLHWSRLTSKLPEYNTVRAFFTEGEPLYPDAGIRSHDHIQICVRKKENIVGYFLPPEIYGHGGK